MGDRLDRIIQERYNEDLWKALVGDLPCLEATESCIKQLQAAAISKSVMLKSVDERVEAIEKAIEEAQKKNDKSIKLAVFEPLLQNWLTVTVDPTTKKKSGVFQRLLGLFGEPLDTINEILGLVGLPIFRTIAGGEAAAQQRAIAITDVQAKLAQVKQERARLADQINEKVYLSLLDWDLIVREYQISHEIAYREGLKLKILEIGYRVGDGDTLTYLGQLTQLEQRKAATFRDWAKLRRQIALIKLLVLGMGEE